MPTHSSATYMSGWAYSDLCTQNQIIAQKDSEIELMKAQLAQQQREIEFLKSQLKGEK